MDEMKPVLERWVVVNCPSFNSLSFGKVSVKLHNFSVPGGLPSHGWSETHPLTMSAEQL